MEDKYISREELIKALETDYNCSWCSKPQGIDEYVEGVKDEYDDVLKIVCGMKAADVQPVKRGTWRKDEQGYDVYVECSECGLNLSVSNYIENEWRETLKYCPCCGARMDGDTNG